MADEKDNLVEKVKEILYLDGDQDDQLVQGYVDAAKAFVQGAIGDDDSFYQLPDVKPLFESAVTALAATYYQYRLSLSDTQTYPVDLTVNSIIGQLRGRYAVKAGDDSETTSKPTQSSNWIWGVRICW